MLGQISEQPTFSTLALQGAPPALLIQTAAVQSVKLQSLAIYFDCDTPLLSPGKRWDLITRERWDELLLPANHTKACSAAPDADTGAVCSQAPLGGPQQQPQQHQFLLCPVDGTLHYMRRGKQARRLETDAEQEIHLQLKHISLRVHQLQYQSGQKLLQEFDSYAASAPHRNLRPHCRPAAGETGICNNLFCSPHAAADTPHMVGFLQIWGLLLSVAA